MTTTREYERQRKAEYRARKKAEKEATGSDGTSAAMQNVLAGNPSKLVLEGIRDNPSALNADRIRASVEIGKIEEAERVQRGADQFAELRQLKDALDAIPPHERRAAVTDLLAVRDDTDEEES